MSLSIHPEVNAYYLDSEFAPRGMTVAHYSAGPTGTGCRGTWETHTELEGEKGSTSYVELQHLLPDASTSHRPKVIERIRAPVTRAVKQLRTKDSWPQRDNWPMIERGLLCLARANVSETIAVVHMLGWYQDPERNLTFIAMEYYPHGNLRDWLHDSPPQGELWAREVIKQILNVLSALDEAGLAHRNIKPSNILIASVLPIRVKLGDFYNAKWAEEDQGLQTQVGTLPYVAPEVRHRTGSNDPYTVKVDIWALGIILHEILTGAHPFCEPGRYRFSDRVYERFVLGETTLVLAPEMASAHAAQFVRTLLERNAVRRLSPAQALVAPWLVQPVG